MLNIQNEINNRWSYSAKGYGNIIRDELSSFKTKAWIELIETQIPKNQMLNILDIGTGPGFFTIILTQAGYNVTGIDGSTEMIRQARINAIGENINPTFKVMDSHFLDFPDNHFDVVLSRNVTWTLHNPIAAYKEWNRVLRPNGRLLIFDANWHLHDYDKELFREVKEREDKFRKKYGAPYDTYDGPKKEKELKVELPLMGRKRPSWDNDVLSTVGFANIKNDLDITEQVWDEKEKLLYGASPMFMITATKTIIGGQ